MAKLTPVEHFRLSCECAVSDLGQTVAELTKLGLTNVQYELITTIPTFAKKAHHEVKAEDFLMTWTQEHPTFKAIDAVNHFRASERTAGACYSALRELCKSKSLRKLGPGNYARADVKAIAAPKNTKTEAAPKGRNDRREISHGDFILRLARRSHGRISLAKVKQAFKDDNRNVSSVHPSVADLVEKKRLKRDGEGMFEVIADAKRANGVAPVEGVAAHG